MRRFVQAFVSFTLHEHDRLILVAREFVNLDEPHKYHADQLKNAHRALLSDIIAATCEPKGKPDAETCLITHAVISMLYGQLHWSEVAMTEQQLTGLLTGCVMRMITGRQANP